VIKIRVIFNNVKPKVDDGTRFSVFKKSAGIHSDIVHKWSVAIKSFKHCQIHLKLKEL